MHSHPYLHRLDSENPDSAPLNRGTTDWLRWGLSSLSQLLPFWGPGVFCSVPSSMTRAWYLQIEVSLCL